MVTYPKKTGQSSIRSLESTYIFVGYSDDSKAYRLIPVDNHYELVRRRDVTFDEKRMAADVVSETRASSDEEPRATANDSDLERDDCEPEDATIEEISEGKPTEEKDERPGRERREPSWMKDYACLCGQDSCEQSSTSNADCPSTVVQAMSSPDRDKWKAAMELEMRAHEKNGTWVLVDRPSDKGVITSKWVFQLERGSDGSITKWEARLVKQKELISTKLIHRW